MRCMLPSSPTAHKFSCPIQDPQSFAQGELHSICNIDYCFEIPYMPVLTTYI